MQRENKQKRTVFNGIVLAGERKKGSPLTSKFQVPLKALIPVAGIPMVQRVIDCLSSSEHIGTIYLCGTDRTLFEDIDGIGRLFKKGALTWIQSGKTPSRSALRALKQAGGELPALLTTADHALLTKEMVDFFCESALETDNDLLVALARLEMLKKAYPDTRRTYYKFTDGRYCTCNLFAFMNQKAFKAAEFWQSVEEKRKHPLKIVAGFGWYWVLRYLTGTLSLEKALVRASHVLGCRAGRVIMPFPEAAVDVDTVNDWELVDKIARG